MGGYFEARRFVRKWVLGNLFRFYTQEMLPNGALNSVHIGEEAELVRRICQLFLEGNSSYWIKRILEADGIKIVIGNTVWQATVIDKMLANEKYMGDALLQATDFGIGAEAIKSMNKIDSNLKKVTIKINS